MKVKVVLTTDAIQWAGEKPPTRSECMAIVADMIQKSFYVVMPLVMEPRFELPTPPKAPRGLNEKVC